MKRYGKCTVRRWLVLMLAMLVLLCAVPLQKAEAVEYSKVERLNVMLVIDGSGSLPDGTDRKGVRYDAIDLFLALLTNEGNNVGAVVFSDELRLHTDITAISGKEAKLTLSESIREAGASGYTNIGLALMAAVDESIAKNQENGMNSVILLMSDGRTDVPGGKEAMEEALETKRLATEKAQQYGIPVHSICLRATKDASPEELMEISGQTSGQFVEVKSAEDLTKAFEAFYSVIFPDTSNKITETTFPESGQLNTEIAIPTYGAEEVNIILDTTNIKDIVLLSPEGELSDAQIEESSMSGGYYDVIKLVDPKQGMWQVNLTGKPGTDVTINVLYNIDSTVQLDTADGNKDFGVGENVVLQAQLARQGQVVTDPAVVNEYTAKLHLTNLATGEKQTVDMVPGANNGFTYTMLGDDYCSWSAQAEFLYSNLSLSSNELAINFGNTTPVANPDYLEVPVTVTPISGKQYQMNVSDYFTDAQDDTLTYEILSSQLIQDTVTLDEKTGEMVVNTAKSKKGNVVVQAKDSQGAVAEMTIYFKVTNLTGLIFGGIAAAVLAGVVVLAIVLYGILNRPWKGMFTVASLDGLISRTHGSFRGKLPLAKVGVRNCGVDGVFVATGNNRMEFRSKKRIYSANGIQANPTRITLMNGTNVIYGDEEHTMGIEVELMPQNGGFRF